MNPRARRWLAAYGITVTAFAVVDLIWIRTVALPLYSRELGTLLAPTADLAVAGGFYLAYVAGIVHFAVRPNDHDASLRQRLGAAALFGGFTYSTWALTALAILDGFSPLVAVTDIAWGAVVCTVVTLITVTVLGTTKHGKAPRPPIGSPPTLPPTQAQ